MSLTVCAASRASQKRCLPEPAAPRPQPTAVCPGCRAPARATGGQLRPTGRWQVQAEPWSPLVPWRATRMSQLAPEPWGFPAGPYKAPPSRVCTKQVQSGVGQADLEGLSAAGMGLRASDARAGVRGRRVLWGAHRRVGDLRSRLVPWELVLNAPVLREGGLGTCSAGRGLGGPSRGHIDPSPPLGPLACRGSWCTKEVSPLITRDSDRGHTPCLRE